MYVASEDHPNVYSSGFYMKGGARRLRQWGKKCFDMKQN
jgi:hypothetical protein